MKIFSVKYWGLGLLLLCFNNTKAQLCPSNLDFEQGDFTGWLCEIGNIINPTGAYNWNPLSTTPVANRHTIISQATAGIDPFGGFPTLCPNGSGYSVRLGNFNTGSEAERISYTYTIPATLTTFSMLFYYAMVIESPTGHGNLVQPRFMAKIYDVSTGFTNPCANFDFIAATAPGGLQLSDIPGHNGSQVYYKDWTPISINLDAYIGSTIKLEFTTNDCALGGHSGYAYVDVNTNCSGLVSGNFICPGDTAITLTAPYGFQTYQWYSDMSMTTVISNSQTLYLNPLPAVGSVYPVAVTPFPGYGCNSTMYATIDVGARPAADAGPDQIVCNGVSVQIGAPSNPSYNYSWNPPGQVSNPLIANPFASLLTAGPEMFYVVTTDIITGCTANDTTYLTAQFVDTALALNGRTTYCVGDPGPGVLSVNNTVTAVQWYNGTTPIPGATGYNYQPITTGNYWAQVQQGGCIDSTRTVSFTINPIPVSSAGPDANICNNQTIQIGTASTAGYSYSWTPTAQVSNPSISDPMAWVPNTTAVEFIVRTTDAATGCYSQDTTYITGRVVDTALTLSGKEEYCTGDALAGALSVNTGHTAIQWYDGTTVVPGATGINFQPTVTGNYWAQLQQFGCTDSTRTISFDIHATPLVSFTPSSDTGCVTRNSFLFTNNSSNSEGATMTYLWRFSDGSTQTVLDAVKTFLSTGSYTVKLITTTEFGCVDSTGFTTVHVLPNGVADFKWDSICVDRPSLFHNLSNENGSVQVNYSWNFNNGGPVVNVKDPGAITYPTAGQLDVTLILTALGCENDPDSVVKKVQVNVSKPGTRYTTITVPEDAKRFIHARDSIGTMFQWLPMVQLSNYNARYTEFTAVNDVLYEIRISDIHTCVTVDTLQMLVLKKPGYYLPTAFTPNGDGLNDVARPYLVRMKSLVSFSVFNRWGDRIFYSQQEGKGWDGRFNGEPQSTGVYVWILEFIDTNNKKVTEKGTITLIR